MIRMEHDGMVQTVACMSCHSEITFKEVPKYFGHPLLKYGSLGETNVKAMEPYHEFYHESKTLDPNVSPQIHPCLHPFQTPCPQLKAGFLVFRVHIHVHCFVRLNLASPQTSLKMLRIRHVNLSVLAY